MSINKAKDFSYQIIGGSYRGYKTKNWKKGYEWLHFVSFQGDLAVKLKNNLEISYNEIDSMYISGLGLYSKI
jgi:hypothetical protein